jgi:hypothetical protein
VHFADLKPSGWVGNGQKNIVVREAPSAIVHHTAEPFGRAPLHSQ